MPKNGIQSCIGSLTFDAKSLNLIVKKSWDSLLMLKIEDQEHLALGLQLLMLLVLNFWR
jgi:hypothetical protein